LPGGDVGAFACAITEYGVEDVDDAHVLINSAVAAASRIVIRILPPNHFKFIS
jgi:hypothetical protein